jgi:hypothetical protein
MQAVEVLWTPEAKNDTVSEKELLRDCPLLRSLWIRPTYTHQKVASITYTKSRYLWYYMLGKAEFFILSRLHVHRVSPVLAWCEVAGPRVKFLN